MDLRLLVAKANFDYTVKDIRTLVDLHDSETKGKRGRPAEKLEVLKRSGIILTLTAWEAFIEDMIGGAFEKRLAAANSPRDIQNTFRAVATSWLNPKDGSRPKPDDLIGWTQDKWKQALRRRFAEELGNLHTPSSAKIRKLSKRYLGFDLTASWKWLSVTSTSACSKLDRLIKRRGELVHRGKDLFAKGRGAKRNEVLSALRLVERLVGCTLAKIPTP